MAERKPQTQPQPESVAEAVLTELSTETLLETQIFIAVLAALAGRGVPSDEAAKLAKEYAEKGAELY